ncbi:DNA replication factor Cdt1-like [Gouania willdenowi]|nr:DNA replication factor Cdt1-like [Gouania willdenowi]
MEKALVSLTLQKEDVPQAPDVPQTAASPAQVPTALKGVSQCLLDRIRAKEVQKLQAAMTRDPEVEERLLMMSRLAELARILRSVFVSEKKPALIMEVVCSRMVDSYRSAMSTGEMEKHVRLLAELVSDWLSIVAVRKDSYLKLNRTMELSLVMDRLTHRQKEEELSQHGLPDSL